LLFDLDDTLVPEEPFAVARTRAPSGAHGRPGRTASGSGSARGRACGAASRAPAPSCASCAPGHPSSGARRGPAHSPTKGSTTRRSRHRLALVTNGAACLQREKLEQSGLAGHFDAVVVSADVGVGKPDPAVFQRALSMLGARADEAVMIGDNLVRDVDGALAAGLRAVWINRFGQPRPPGRDDLVEISGLAELPAVL
jgi:hypothetical protein